MGSKTKAFVSPEVKKNEVFAQVWIVVKTNNLKLKNKNSPGSGRGGKNNA